MSTSTSLVSLAAIGTTWELLPFLFIIDSYFWDEEHGWLTFCPFDSSAERSQELSLEESD